MEALAQDFDVAISFAGSDRHYARDLRGSLLALGLRVFYDEDYKAELVGEELTELLSDIYRDRCRLCVVLISASYRDSEWARLEKRAALEAALKKDAHVVPVLLDSVKIPGLRRTVGYLDTKSLSVNEVADVIALKVLSQTQKLDVPVDLANFRGEVSVVGIPSQGPALPIAQAHLSVISRVASAKLRELLEYIAVRDLDDILRIPAEVRQRVDSVIEQASYVGPSYSLQISLISEDQTVIAHADLRPGTLLYKILPGGVVEAVGRSMHEQMKGLKLGTSSAFFGWADFLRSAKHPSTSPLRYNIGLITYCIPGGYVNPSMFVFGEAHCRLRP